MSIFLAAGASAICLRDGDGTAYVLRPDGSVIITRLSNGETLPLPPFVRPTFQAESDGTVLVATQTAKRINIFRVIPYSETLKQICDSILTSPSIDMDI